MPEYDDSSKGKVGQSIQLLCCEDQAGVAAAAAGSGLQLVGGVPSTCFYFKTTF